MAQSKRKRRATSPALERGDIRIGQSKRSSTTVKWEGFLFNKRVSETTATAFSPHRLKQKRSQIARLVQGIEKLLKRNFFPTRQNTCPPESRHLLVPRLGLKPNPPHFFGRGAQVCTLCPHQALPFSAKFFQWATSPRSSSMVCSSSSNRSTFFCRDLRAASVLRARFTATVSAESSRVMGGSGLSRFREPTPEIEECLPDVLRDC